MSEILVIRNVQVYDVSAQQNTLVIGSPSPATLCGAALALCRKLNIEFVSAAFVIHDFVLHPGHPRFVPHVTERAASTLDVVSGDLRLSLLIEFDGRQPVPDPLDHMAVERAAYWVSWLRDAASRHLRNIAGGRVIEPPAVANVTMHADPLAALRAIRHFGGSVLVDRSELMQGHADPLAAVIAHLTISEDGTKLTKGWLVPIHVGFQGIEPPTLRKANRQKVDAVLPHSFAECITSLAQYISVRRLLALQHCFWRYRFDASERTYYVTAR